MDSRHKIDATSLRRLLAVAIVGYEQLREALLVAYFKASLGLPRAHVLMFGPPGVGKTFATKTFARLVGEVAGKSVSYARIQGRADLMPEEFLAERVAEYDAAGRPRFAYQLGAIGGMEKKDGGLPGVLQFDELDKTPARTQHGLLEAMEEQQLSIADGSTVPLHFTLVATANTRRFDPASQPIPRATQDRFGSVVFVDYLPLEGDQEVLNMHVRTWNLGVTADPRILRGMCEVVKLSQRRLDRYSDFMQHVKVPAGPRGYLDLYTESATQAMLDGRSHLTVQDVRDVACRVLRGRIEVKAEAELAGKNVEVLISDMVEEVFGGMKVRVPSPSETRAKSADADEAKADDSGEKGDDEPASEDKGRPESKDNGESEPKSGAGQPDRQSTPPAPRTKPTGGQGRRPTPFLSGLRQAAREDPTARPPKGPR